MVLVVVLPLVAMVDVDKGVVTLSVVVVEMVAVVLAVATSEIWVN